VLGINDFPGESPMKKRKNDDRRRLLLPSAHPVTTFYPISVVSLDNSLTARDLAVIVE
jgi:hypothetical protein